MVRFMCGTCRETVHEVATSRYCGGSIPCPHCGAVNEYPVKEFKGKPEDFEPSAFAPTGDDLDGVVQNITEKHAEFLRSRGYAGESAEQAHAFIANLNPKERTGFFADFDAWVKRAERVPASQSSATNDGQQDVPANE